MTSQHCSGHFTITEVFPDLGPYLTTGVKYCLTSNFLKYFFVSKLFYEKISQAQSNQFIFKEAPAYKRGKRKSTTATHSDVIRVLSSVFIIAQSDTRNTKYLISQLQKISLQQLLLRKLLFAFFQRYYNYFYRILVAIHSFNGTVHFSDLKICSHPV